MYVAEDASMRFDDGTQVVGPKAFVKKIEKQYKEIEKTYGRRDALRLKLQKEHLNKSLFTSDCTKSNALENIEKLTKELGD